MEELAKKVGAMLRNKSKTLAIAESCTGGLVASSITDIAGSSDYFAGGIVAYSNQVKHELLHVPEPLINDYGAVSPPVAAAMAHGVRKLMNADIGVAVTGIAGPGGGSAKKPVGYVCFGLASAKESVTSESHFYGDRITIKQAAARKILEMLREYLIKG